MYNISDRRVFIFVCFCNRCLDTVSIRSLLPHFGIIIICFRSFVLCFIIFSYSFHIISTCICSLCSISASQLYFCRSRLFRKSTSAISLKIIWNGIARWLRKLTENEQAYTISAITLLRALDLKIIFLLIRYVWIDGNEYTN